MEALILKDKKNLHWDYDQDGDVLYISMNKPVPAETIDLGNGTLARIDPKTNEIVGFTILNPKGRILEQLG